jgi:uncharacterized protein (TIGR00297 family)
LYATWLNPVVSRWFWALPVTLAFAALAYVLRGVDRSGAAAGVAVALPICLGAGPAGFLLLFTLFALTWLATRFGRHRRASSAEPREGRTASQVMANVGVAAAAATLAGLTGNSQLYLPMVAAFAEAAADTASSECGQGLSSHARLITTGERVPAGTDGGVSVAGSLVGVAAAAVLGMLGHATGLLSWRTAAIATGSGIIGMAADSVLGAVFERRQLLSNDQVNLLSTLIAAGLAFGLGRA